MLVRQRPGTASGVVFVTLEDEFGIANLVVWPKVFEAHRRDRHGLAPARRLAARVQREGIVIHLVAEKLWDWSADLDRIADDSTVPLRAAPAAATRPAPRRPIRATSPGTRATSAPARVPSKKPPYDRSRIIFDRPQIKIA